MRFKKTILPWVSCTHSQFVAIYESTWLLLQTHHSFSMEEEAILFEFVCHALKIRKGLLVSRFLSIEQNAEESPQWTYALFLSALLVKGGALLNVSLSPLSESAGSAQNEKMSCWSVYVPDDIFLWLKANERLIYALNEMDFSAAGFQRLYVPMLEHHELLWVLHKTVLSLSSSRVPAEESAFASLDMKEEIENAAAGESTEHASPGDSQVNAEVLYKKLLQWIKITKTIEIDQYSFMVDSGLLLTEPILNAFAQHQSLTMPVAQLKTQLHPFCVSLKNKYTHCYRSTQVQDRRSYTGIVLARQYLDEDWLAKPIQSHFILYV